MRAQGAQFLGVFAPDWVGLAAISVRTHCFSGRVLYVENVVFKPELRGSGLGRALMQWIEAHAIEQGCNMVTLDAYQKNHAARSFYERLGYDPRGVHFVKEVLR
jgi:GNAT superfamily N-acetyltransferase